MPTFSEIAQKFTLQTVKDSFTESLTDFEREQIIKTIQNRLYNSGMDGEGEQLRTLKGQPFYAPYTMDIKQFSGQPYDRVTLKDSGDFHKSFDLQMIEEGFEIAADFEKQDGHISRNFRFSPLDFERRITKMTEGEFNRFLEYMLKKVIEKLKIKI